MKVRFENLGIIDKIDFDLDKKISIFCGPNGTGKTYVSYMIYGFLKHALFSSVKVLNEKDLITKGELDIEITPDILKLAINRSIRNIKKMYIKDLFTTEVGFEKFKTECLDSSDDDIIEEIKRKHFNEKLGLPGVDIYLKKDEGSLVVKATAKIVHLEENIKSIPPVLNYIMFKLLLSNTMANPVILPVERNSVYTFSKELSIKRLKNTPFNIQEFEERTSRYPLAIVDTLVKAEDLTRIQKRKSSYYDLGVDIEQNLLGGNITITDLGDVVFKPNALNGRELPFLLSASVVKTLSGIVIYLKHEAQKNQTLIIDEPEINLHPDSQILLARILVRMVNAGIRLVISTHSDYIIRELNNMIMLSNKSVNRTKFGYKEDESLNPEDVGAYFFNFTGEKGTHVIVENLPINKDGFEVSTIDDAIASLNKRSLELYYQLKEGENE